jgi:photosystem II stability/assembly factor-like uncharacterized protein
MTAPLDARLFSSLQWRCIGPHRGGRVVAVAGHPTEAGTFYFGACAGGVWKTTNAGSHWRNVSDGYFRTAAVGALAVSDADPSVVYAGTGETTIRSNVSHGDGVYRSTDGGRTWRNLGLARTRHIGAIAVHPRDPDLVYVAALGHAWGPNPERGVYRSRDGGHSWELVLHKSERAGSPTLSMDPRNPRVLYASIWQAQRYPHAASSGGEDSGLWRSLDGGDTWTDLSRNPGLPKGLLGKIGVATSPARPGRVWALVEAEDGALFRSDDYGDTWQRLAEDPELRRRPWYYMHVFADPQDADTVWVLNLNCWKSTDGGKTFEIIPTPHGDNHALWIDPRDSDRLIEGNDGGACVSLDGARSWSTILNQPTAQFYHVTTDHAAPYHVYGSQQDNWAMRLPSIGFEGAIAWNDYAEPGGGESGYIAVSPNPPHLVFGGAIGTGTGHGRLIAWDPATGQKRNVTVWPEVHGWGSGAEALKYRFQWTFPIEVSPHDPTTLYVCSNYVHRSRDEGASWEVISPDLTRNDPSKLGSSGGPITADNSGAEIYCTIFAFRESPHEAGVLWAGSDDGLLHVSRDGGHSWANVTPPDLPEWALITIIEPAPHAAATVYVAATCYKSDDTRPYLYKTDDYGGTWTKITAGIPDDEFTRVIRADPGRPGLLYCGTETGLYVSFDDGASWQPLSTNLPVVPIWDLVVKGTDLVAATHGRSFWILDDVTPLHQLQASVADEPAHLFAPRDTTRFRVYARLPEKPSLTLTNYQMTGPVTVAVQISESPDGERSEAYVDAGQNPPAGVIVHYWLKDEPADPIQLSILDEAGNEVRTYTSKRDDKDKKDDKDDKTPVAPAKAGMNRFVWDYRHAPPTRLEHPPKEGPFAEGKDDELAPRALPGRYQVRLTVGDRTLTRSFAVVPDPRLSVTAADLAAQFELKTAIRDRASEANVALNRIHRVRTQLDEWVQRAKGPNDEQAARLEEAATQLKDQLRAVEGALINLDAERPRPGPAQIKEKLAALSGLVDEAEQAPTQGAREVYELLRERLEAQREKLDLLLGEAVPSFRELVRTLGIPPLVD